MTDQKNNFDAGYACAVACIVKNHGAGTETREALEANGLTTMDALKKRGVDPHDQEILRPLIVEIESKERYWASYRTRRTGI